MTLRETANPDSPAEVIRVAIDAWHNEFLWTSQYPDMVPSCSAKKTLRDVLPKLGAVDLEAVGWSDELKACRFYLNHFITSRLNELERKTPTLSRLRCRSRCFCRSVASDNAQSIIDPQKLFEPLLDLAGETCDDGLLSSSASRLTTGRRLAASGVLHHIWHDHHDRVAPLCLEWYKSWDQPRSNIQSVQGVKRLKAKYSVQGRQSLKAKHMRLIHNMLKIKQRLEVLDLDGDLELTTCRQDLTDDIKMMVSSLRIFKLASA